MKVTPTADLPDVLILEPKVFGDERGFFFESFNQQRLRRRASAAHVEFVQDNHSRSARRRAARPALPVDAARAGQAGARGARQRRSTWRSTCAAARPTFGRWVGVELERREPPAALDPAGLRPRLPGARATTRRLPLQDDRLLRAGLRARDHLERPGARHRLAGPGHDRRCWRPRTPQRRRWRRPTPSRDAPMNSSNNSNKIPVQPVIMAGGSGTRLWPLSRAAYPKQFLVLADNRSLFQQASSACTRWRAARSTWPRRSSWATRSTASWCSTSCANSAHASGAAAARADGRNTAPAMTLAALQALRRRRRPGARGHAGRPDRHRRRRVHAGAAQRRSAVAARGRHRDPRRHARPSGNRLRLHPAARTATPARSKCTRFVEKPDLATAERYLADGDY